MAIPDAPGPGEHDADVTSSFFFTTLQRVDQRGEDHHRGPVLVVVEDGDVELLAQAVARSRSSAGAEMSSRLMPPKIGRDRAARSRTISSTSFVVEAERERVDAGELLEQAAPCPPSPASPPRADVAEPEHRGAVGDDGDGVAA